MFTNIRLLCFLYIRSIHSHPASGASCTGLAVHSYFRSHYLGKFSHFKLELSSVYLQHSFLSGFFRVCQGTITSTLGAYSHLWTKGKRVRFSNFQLPMFKNWQISLFYCYKILYRDAPTREANPFLVHMPFSFMLPLSNTFYWRIVHLSYT